MITRDDVDKYMQGTELERLYNEIEAQYLINSTDTLSDEFQILAAIRETIWKYVEEKNNG